MEGSEHEAITPTKTVRQKVCLKCGIEIPVVAPFCPRCALDPDNFTDVDPEHRSTIVTSRQNEKHSEMAGRQENQSNIIYPLRHFELFEEIGRGGMGIVYKALQRNAGGREVAVKTVLANRSEHPRFAQWFLREARATLNLNHPNVVMAIEADEFSGMPYLAMEFVDGPSLSQILQRRRKLSVGFACHILAQVAKGLQHAHKHGFIHRDLKPSNILLRSDGIAKICDLGLVGYQGPSELSEFGPMTTCIMGTPGYSAPEQLDGLQVINHVADFYAVGVTLHQILFGELPTSESSFLEMSSRLPGGLAGFGASLLEPDPMKRPQSADQLVCEFEKYSDSGGLEAILEDSRQLGERRSITLTDLPPLPKPTVSRKSFLILAGAALAAPTAYAISRVVGGREPMMNRSFENTPFEDVVPHKKYPLFGKQPTPFWGNEADEHLSVNLNRQKMRLIANSRLYHLYKVCEIPFENFDLEVTVVQKQIKGDFGLFFFGDQTGEVTLYESLDVFKIPTGEIVMNHRENSLSGIAESIDYTPRELGRIEPMIFTAAEYTIRVECRHNRLHESRLSGENSAKLKHPLRKPAPVRSGRSFGIIINGEESTFRDAYLSVWAN